MSTNSALEKDPAPDAVVLDGRRSGQNETRKQIRGSSLLVAGRFWAVLIACVTQILIVRYLSKGDYGAFEYALSFVAVGETFITFGLDRAVARFLPIYDEQGDKPRLVGTLALGIGTIAALGSSSMLLFYSLHSWLTHSMINDRTASTLLLIMVLLAPVQALDNLLTGIFAVFASPRAIFLRKHILGPGLRLVVVLLLISGKCSLFFLGGGYLISGIVGVALYAGILLQALRSRGLLEHFKSGVIRMPGREVFSFCAPILMGDIALTLLNAIDTILLGYFRSAPDVAAFRVVQPTARLNQLVLVSFGLLFTPAAARMFARRDWKSLNVLYWQTAIWMAVISFPIFVLTFSLARPLTTLLFGARYVDSAPILAIVSLGYYVNAAFGANGTMLVVFGRTRYVVMGNVAVVIINLALAFLLIPAFGALGAAIAMGSTLVMSNLIKQNGLRGCNGIRFFDRRCAPVYAVIIACAVVLLAQEILFKDRMVSFAAAMVASGMVLLVNRHALNVEQTFPELLRFALVRRLIATKAQTDVRRGVE